MSQEQPTQEHHHADQGCGVCGGDPEAAARQETLEERAELIEASLKVLKGRARVFFSDLTAKAKVEFEPVLPTNIVSTVGAAGQKLRAYYDRNTADIIGSPAIMSVGDRLRGPNDTKTSLAAGMVPVVLATSMLSPTVAEETPQTPEQFDEAVLKQIASDLIQSPTVLGDSNIDGISVSKVDGVTFYTKTPQEQKLGAVVNNESLRPASSSYRLDMSEVPKASRDRLLEVTNVDSAEEQEIIEIKQPLIRSLHSGASPTDLARAMLGQEAAKDRAVLGALTNVILDMNNIDVAQGEDRVIPAGTEISLPYEMEGIEGVYVVKRGDTASSIAKTMGWGDIEKFAKANALIDPKFIVPGWEILPPKSVPPVEAEEMVNSDTNQDEPKTTEGGQVNGIEQLVAVENKDRMTEALAREALDQIIKIVESIENPTSALPGLDGLISSRPTEIANSLGDRRAEVIDELVAGTTTLASLQTEVMTNLVLEQSSLNNLGDAARLFVRSVYTQVGVTPTDGQVEAGVLAVVDQDESSQILLAEDIEFESTSTPIFEIKQQLENELAIKTEVVEVAAERLETLGIDVTVDSRLLAVRLLELGGSLQLEGDEYYYMLLEGKQQDDQAELVMNTVVEAIYGGYGANELLESPEITAKLVSLSADMLNGRYISLGNFITQVDSELGIAIDRATTEVTPIIAEIVATFPEASQLEDERLANLVIKHMAGYSADFVRMSVLQELTQIRSESLDEVVAGYFKEALAFNDLNNAFDNQRIQQAIDQALTTWQSGDTVRLVKLNAQETIDKMIDATLQEFVVGNEKYLVDLSDDPQVASRLADIAKQYLNLPSPDGATRDRFNLLLIEAASTNAEQAIRSYVVDYYSERDAAYYLDQEQVVIGVIARLVLEGRANLEDFTEQLASYSGNPEELFPEGRQFVMTGYEGQDLKPFFDELGIDYQAILKLGLNSNLVEDNGRIIAQDAPTLWLDNRDLSLEILTKAYDEIVLGIVPVETLNPPDEVVENTEVKEKPPAVEEKEPLVGIYYSVVKGDTLSEIAVDYVDDSGNRLTAASLKAYNSIVDGDSLQIGQTIVIPQGYEFKQIVSTPKSTTLKETQPTKEVVTATINKVFNYDLSQYGLGVLTIEKFNGFPEKTKKIKDVTAVVIHYTGALYDDANPAAGVVNGLKGNKACGDTGCSTQFFITQDGSVSQLTPFPDSKAAHTKGASSFSIGIELEARNATDITPAQRTATAKLSAWLSMENDISMDHSVEKKRGIFGHYQIDGSSLDPKDSGKTDPGPELVKFVRDRVEKALEGFNQGEDKGQSESEEVSFAERVVEKVTGPVYIADEKTLEKVTIALYEKYGMAEKGAAWFAMNLDWESGMKPDIRGDKGKALGLAQWHLFRRERIIKQFGSFPTTVEGQLKAAIWEMKKYYPKAWAIYTDPNATDAELSQAAKIYEGYGKKGERDELAKEYVRLLGVSSND